MKHLLSLSILIYLAISTFSQGLLPGILTLQNSGNKPIPGAYITTNVGSGSDKTKADGTFLLRIAGKSEGLEVLLSVEKEGLEIVNKKELLVTLKKDRSRRLKLFMCPKGQWHENALAFYEINKGVITQNHEQRIKRLEGKISDQTLLKDSLETLSVEYKSALKEAEKLSFDFAKTNLDDANEVYKKAYELFIKGDLEGALDVLRKERSPQKLKEDVTNKQELERLIQIKDSTIEIRI